MTRVAPEPALKKQKMDPRTSAAFATKMGGRTRQTPNKYLQQKMDPSHQKMDQTNLYRVSVGRTGRLLSWPVREREREREGPPR